MDNSVTVVNLRTGGEQIYMGISSEEAVMTAFLQAGGNFNTWTYPDMFATMRKDIKQGRTGNIWYGDFCTKRNK